jgi:outer membrane immunogenic protein
MKLFSLSRWVTFGALVLTIGSGFSRSAYGQAQTPFAGHEQMAAKADAAPLATLSTVSPVAVAHANSAPVPPPPSSSFTWTGFYVGVNVGHGSSDGDTFVNPLPTAAIFVNLLPQTLNLDPSGSLGGGQLGYNHQFGHFVLGVEADIDAAGIQETTLVTPIIQNNNTPFPGTPPGNDITVHQNTDAISTVRPRFGFAFGHFLLYGTGGLAIAHIGYTANTDFHPVGTETYPANFSKTQKGWAAGGGAEVGIGGGFSLKGEYLRYDVGSQQSFTANPVPPFPPSAPPFQIAYTWHTSSARLFRFGANYRF